MIRVLVADDSFFMKKLLKELLISDKEIEVVGLANNGQEAVIKARELRPDVITMDQNMPVVDGLTAVREILSDPVTGKPAIIMISAYTQEGSKVALEALRLGAVDFVKKPSGELSMDIDIIKDEIIQKVKTAALARVNIRSELKRIARDKKKPKTLAVKVVVIGSSTGGPPIVEDILKDLPANFPASVVVVQHLPEFFVSRFAERLDEISPLYVKEVEDKDDFKAGQVLVASANKCFLGGKEQPKSGPHPCINNIMSYIANLYGSQVIGIILTGMGEDGRDGIEKIKQKGGYIIAQDPETATIASMPQAIVDAKLADEILPPEKIAKRLIELVSK